MARRRPKPRTRARTGATRARLVEATLTVLRDEGPSALTCARLAREAAIAQPGFYKHFDNLEDCVAAASEEIARRLRDAVRSIRRDAGAALSPTRGQDRRAIMTQVARATIDALLADPTATTLALSLRRQTTPLGESVRAVLDEARTDLVDDLWAWARASGLGAERFPRIAAIGELIQGQLLAAVEALLDGRFEDRDLLASTLGDSMHALLLAELAR